MKTLTKMLYVAVGTIATSPAYAALENLKLKGEEAKVNDNDLYALLVNIGAAVISILCGLICIYGVYSMLTDTWTKVKEYREGRVSTLGAALEPLLTNGALAAFTFGVAFWLVTNYVTWMS